MKEVSWVVVTLIGLAWLMIEAIVHDCPLWLLPGCFIAFVGLVFGAEAVRQWLEMGDE